MRNRSPGRYEPLQLLGEGPYGAVHLARDGFAGGRLVVLKVLDPRRLPEGAIARLQREFMVRRGLRHPNVAELYDLDFDDAGACRLVSEHVPGKPFLEAAEELGPDAIADLAVQALHGLGHLHDCGLLHGAVKPGNVRVASAPGELLLKLIDFDLGAKSEVRPASEPRALHYAAPEVLRGGSHELPADLYAVGMLLHHAIAGRFPFEDPACAPSVVAWHLSRDVPRAPPGHALSAVVERLLDPDPGRRFPSTHEAVRAISAACGRRFRSRARPAGEQVLVSGRFVGRDREVRRLAAACRRIVGGGGAQVVLLVGAPGMGKTRALEECRVLGQMSGVRVVHAACGAGNAPPLGVLRDLLRQVVVLVGKDHAVCESHVRVLRDLLPEEFPGPAARAIDRAGCEPAAADDRWTVVRNGAAAFLASVAQQRPVMLLVDDLEAIDAPSIDVLRWVFRHFSACPLMLVAGMAEAPFGGIAPPVARPLEDEAHEVLRLGPLQSQDVEEVLAGVLAMPGGVRELAAVVLRLTGGVPLYVEEVVRALAEGTAVDLVVQAEAADAPSSARDRAAGLVVARLDRLPPGPCRVLDALWAFGGPAGMAELAGVVPHPSGDTDAVIRDLEASDLVRVLATSSGLRVALRNGLVREAVGSRLASGRRADLHDRIAAWIGARGDRSPERSAALAFHAARGSDPNGAVPALVAAAREASDRHAFEAARALLERARALSAAAGDADGVANALDLLGEALSGLGETDAALRALHELVATPETACARRVSARVRIAGIQASHGRIALAEDTLALAAGEAASCGDDRLLGAVERARGRLALASAPDRALAFLDRAKTLLRGDPHALARTLGEIGEAHLALGEHGGAWACHRESLARCLALRDRAGVARAHLNLGLVAWAEARRGDALTRFDRGKKAARRLGHHPLMARALWHRGGVELRSGRLADAVRTLTQSLDLMRRVEDEAGTGDAMTLLARVHLAAGRHEMARLAAEDVVARRGRTNDLSGVAAARILLGDVLRSMGAIDDAETLLRTAADAAEQLGLDRVAADALVGLAEVALARGRMEEAAGHLERERRAAMRALITLPRVRADLARARVASAAGADAARPMLAAALRSARRCGDAASAAEGRALAGCLRAGPGAAASLRAARRAADASGLRELSWSAGAGLARLLLDAGDPVGALDAARQAMVVLRAVHDDLPVRWRRGYLDDPRKQALRAVLSEVVELDGVPAR